MRDRLRSIGVSRRRDVFVTPPFDRRQAKMLSGAIPTDLERIDTRRTEIQVQEARSSAPATEAILARRAAWRLIPLAISCVVLEQLYRSNVGFAALTMPTDVALTPLTFGFGVGLFAVGYVLFDTPRMMVDGKAMAAWTCRVILTWGVLSIATAFVATPTGFAIMRFLLGLAEAGFVPALMAYVAFRVPQGRRALAAGLWTLAVPLAAIIGGPVSGLLLELDGAWDLAGWQWLFLVEGLPSAIVALCAYFLLPSAPVQAARQFTGDTVANAGRALTLGLLQFGMSIGISAISLWLPVILRSLVSLANLRVTFVIAVIWMGAAIASALWLRVAARSGDRPFLLAAPFFAATAGFLLGAFLPSAPLAIVCLALGVSGVLAAGSVFWSMPEPMSRGASAPVARLGNLGGFIGPVVIGWLRESTGDFADSLIFLAGATCIAGAIAMLLRRLRTNDAGETAVRTAE